MDLADIAQIANRVSGAKLHSLTFGAIRGKSNGLPLEPAMIAKEHGNATPLLGLGRQQIEPLGFDTSGFAHCHQELPLLGGDGFLNLFIIVAAVG